MLVALRGGRGLNPEPLLTPEWAEVSVMAHGNSLTFPGQYPTDPAGSLGNGGRLAAPQNRGCRSPDTRPPLAKTSAVSLKPVNPSGPQSPDSGDGTGSWK